MINLNQSKSKQLLIAAACFLMLLNFFSISIFASEKGSCGDEVKWNLSNGILTISGSGGMADYQDGNYAPWYDIKEKIKTIEILDGVTSIGDLAFYDCENLTKVVISNSVKRIGHFAFLDCGNLKSVDVSESLILIGKAAFKMCQSLKSFGFPNTVSSIHSEAFLGCKSLTDIYLPISVTELGESVFAYCDQLKKVTIESAISEVPEWTFYGCDNLQVVSFSKTITNVGELSFYDCDQLDYVYSSSTTVSTVASLTEQIQKDIPDFDGVEASSRKASEVEINESLSNDSSLVFDHYEDGNSSFYGSINSNGDSYNVTIDAVVSDNSMWDSIVEKTDTYLQLNDDKKDGSSVDVNIVINNDLKVSKDIFKKFAGQNAVLNIEANGLKVKIRGVELNSNQFYHDLNLNYTLEKISEYDEITYQLLKNADAYSLRFKGSAEYPMTIQIPLGKQYAYGYATLFEKNGNEWKLVHSVRIDSAGNVSLYLNGFDSLTQYMIGLNVEGVNITNAYIPSELTADYGLTDDQGNLYEITGVQSKWGLTLTQVTVILVCVMVGFVLIIGGIMFLIYKLNQNKEKIRREVMNENIKNKR